MYGAPGTGKTLIARALAASCSRAGAEVSFYMRKGADVLSKWVGESERQLRLLFAEAQKRQPSIIFFDEIDGLAPVRSSKTDQIHNSIVATLLALMDGLDSRGRVVVLGATNRVDAVDGAVRRPGRSTGNSRSAQRRRGFEILKIHTRVGRNPAVAAAEQLAARCVGYCGADLKALCTEAAVHALGRRYPRLRERRQVAHRPRADLTGPRGFQGGDGGHHPRVASQRAGAREAPRPCASPSWVPRLVKPWRRRFSRFPRRRWRPTPTKTPPPPPVHPVRPSRRPPRWCSTSTTSTTTTRTTARSCSKSSTAARGGSKEAPASRGFRTITSRRIATATGCPAPPPRLRSPRRRSSSSTARSRGSPVCCSTARAAGGPLAAALLHELEAFPVHAGVFPVCSPTAADRPRRLSWAR